MQARLTISRRRARSRHGGAASRTSRSSECWPRDSSKGRALSGGWLAEGEELRNGEILVAPTTAPPWTPLFARAAAIVTDTGGILSHCAVVAREYAIPAVVGTRRATAVLQTGQLLEVDGT